MYYITTMQHRKPRQITWEDVILDKIEINLMANEKAANTGTITRKYETIPPEVLKMINVDKMIVWLKNFNELHSNLHAANKEDLYNTFCIPKATGGFRRIDAPCEELQNSLRELVTFIKNDCGVLYHTSAFAYVSKRSIIDCLKKHQGNESNWYLKTDFSGFFPNTTLEFVMEMLKMIFPLSEICKREDGYKELEKAISLGFLNGGLPQGTVLSPLLTNIICIPIDLKLFNECAKRHIVYTRYADDMHISAQEQFPYMNIIKLINDTLKEFKAPWTIKKEKTHYGNRNGKNWCLGLMINKDNNITIGYRNKKYFKAALCSFILDTKNHNYWNLNDVNHLRGQLSYYTMVEPDYINNIVNQQNKKWNVNVKRMMKDYLNGKLIA